MPRVLSLAAVCLLAAGIARAAVVEIVNGAEPRNGVEHLRLESAWRLGGEDDDESFFGVVDDVALDRDGNVLLADVQLMQVSVVGPDGAILATLGRQGEGPGEVTRLGGVVGMPGGTVGLIQLMPGRIVMVDGEGLPAGDITPRWGRDGGRLMLTGLQRSGADLVAAGRRMVRRDDTFNMDLWIAPLADDGTLGEPYYHVERQRNPRSTVISELDGDWAGAGRWAVMADGRVAIAPDRDAYRIEIHGPEGPERVITRAFESRARTATERAAVEERMTRFRGRGRGGRRPAAMQVETADTEADIQQMFPRPDGSLWVLTSRGGHEQPDGALVTYDVLDSVGNFERQVVVECEGRFRRDALFPLSDGRFVLVKGHADALAAMRGTDLDEADAALDDAAPLEIVGLRVAEKH